MRLTKYEPNGESMFPYKLKDEELSTELDSIHKLGQLEDIEEELGIDLITLFKALKQGYIYYPINCPDDCFKYKIEYLNYHNYWYLYIADGVGEVYLEDYGKTWSLDKKDLIKEELKDEI